MGSASTPRVAHVLRKYDPAEWGGTETHVVEVVRRLGAHGWAPEVHAPRGPSMPDTALGDVPLIRYRTVTPFLATAARRRALVASSGNIASFDEPLRLLRDRGLSLAHLHTTGRIGGAVRAAMRWTGRPYVVSVHGPMLANRAWLRADVARRLRGTLDLGRPIGALLGARRVLDDAARVIAFNEEERAALAERIGGRAVRMDHGVDAARFGAGSAERARGRWPALGSGPCVLLVGRVAEQKNQLLAVRAFARGAPPDGLLVLAGAETDPGYRARVAAEARALGVAARVLFLGNVPRSEVPDLCAAASLVIVPSTHEAFGLAVLEGWAAGRAVLFARHSGLADLADAVGPGRGAVAELTPEAWAGALARALAEPGERDAIARVGLALVRARYDWARVTARLAELYREVLEEAQGATKGGRRSPCSP